MVGVNFFRILASSLSTRRVSSSCQEQTRIEQNELAICLVSVIFRQHWQGPVTQLIRCRGLLIEKPEISQTYNYLKKSDGVMMCPRFLLRHIPKKYSDNGSQDCPANKPLGVHNDDHHLIISTIDLLAHLAFCISQIRDKVL